jgi:hypothetical protein
VDEVVAGDGLAEVALGEHGRRAAHLDVGRALAPEQEELLDGRDAVEVAVLLVVRLGPVGAGGDDDVRVVRQGAEAPVGELADVAEEVRGGAVEVRRVDVAGGVGGRGR